MHYDVIIVGSGIAAYAVARRLAAEKRVAIVTKSAQTTSNSMLAQGGIASAFSEEDHWKVHYEDTLKAGDNHSNKLAVTYLVQQGPRVVRELIAEGMEFDQDESAEYLLGSEGAHSYRRILHAGGDATGKKLTSFLYKEIDHQIDLIDYCAVVELVVEQERCVGVKVVESSGEILSFYSDHVVLATGGCGNLFTHSSNAATANGEGLSLAYYAGAKLVDLEFVQFHPTVLEVDHGSCGLISEAVRGEGALLVTAAGERIMEHVHPLKDLAPRDIVAREVYRRMMGGEKIYLSINHVKNFTGRFPTITSLCMQEGIDLSNGMIPIKPGAHFHMGGIQVNQVGQTSVNGLYAVGEVACTGVHGANRLASNSLLEGLVYGESLANFILDQPISHKRIPHVHMRSGNKVLLSAPFLAKIKELMTHHVGIERTSKKLGDLVGELGDHLSKVDVEDLGGYRADEILRIHQMTAAYLIAKSAYEREESRGAHYCVDFPEKNKEWEGRQIVQFITRNLESGGKKTNEFVKSEKTARAVFT
ncbi:L-aspartate oxidase [Jeotgalibacillus marinus]|uniref:L-aspartate oxidase n=1 Tax=Jeotgalibacillus marinus TaxID=86667 RepID=A0ABV3Q3G1_9BACL